jgi:hypothetical protein
MRFARVLDGHLEGWSYVACGRLTIADFQLASMPTYWRESDAAGGIPERRALDRRVDAYTSLGGSLARRCKNSCLSAELTRALGRQRSQPKVRCVKSALDSEALAVVS